MKQRVHLELPLDYCSVSFLMCRSLEQGRLGDRVETQLGAAVANKALFTVVVGYNNDSDTSMLGGGVPHDLNLEVSILKHLDHEFTRLAHSSNTRNLDGLSVDLFKVVLLPAELIGVGDEPLVSEFQVSAPGVLNVLRVDTIVFVAISVNYPAPLAVLNVADDPMIPEVGGVLGHNEQTIITCHGAHFLRQILVDGKTLEPHSGAYFRGILSRAHTKSLEQSAFSMAFMASQIASMVPVSESVILVFLTAMCCLFLLVQGVNCRINHGL